jgi:hypothetical protein
MVNRRAWTNKDQYEFFTSMMSNCSSKQHVQSKEDLKEAVMEWVSQEIDKKLETMRYGQGLGLVLNFEILQQDGTPTSAPNQRHSESAINWRQSVFEKDNYTCVACGCRGKLQAHHIKPWAEYPTLRYEVSNGVTLCPQCHSRLHPGHEALIMKARYKEVS